MKPASSGRIVYYVPVIEGLEGYLSSKVENLMGGLKNYDTHLIQQNIREFYGYAEAGLSIMQRVMNDRSQGILNEDSVCEYVREAFLREGDDSSHIQYIDKEFTRPLLELCEILNLDVAQEVLDKDEGLKQIYDNVISVTPQDGEAISLIMQAMIATMPTVLREEALKIFEKKNEDLGYAPTSIGITNAKTYEKIGYSSLTVTSPARTPSPSGSSDDEVAQINSGVTKKADRDSVPGTIFNHPRSSGSSFVATISKSADGR